MAEDPVDISTTDLEELRNLCLEYYSNEKPNIRCIILYGGAAKSFIGRDHEPGDFDLNLFFSPDSNTPSTHGSPEKIGKYRGLEVEVMRNKVPDEKSIKQYVDEQNSKRWPRIRSESVIQIFPEIRPLDW